MWSLPPCPSSTILIYQWSSFTLVFNFSFYCTLLSTQQPSVSHPKSTFPTTLLTCYPFPSSHYNHLSWVLFLIFLSWVTFTPVIGPATQTVQTHTYKLTNSTLILLDLSILADPANNCFHSQVFSCPLNILGHGLLFYSLSSLCHL